MVRDLAENVVSYRRIALDSRLNPLEEDEVSEVVKIESYIAGTLVDSVEANDEESEEEEEDIFCTEESLRGMEVAVYTVKCLEK